MVLQKWNPRNPRGASEILKVWTLQMSIKLQFIPQLKMGQKMVEKVASTISARNAFIATKDGFFIVMKTIFLHCSAPLPQLYLPHVTPSSSIFGFDLHGVVGKLFLSTTCSLAWILQLSPLVSLNLHSLLTGPTWHVSVLWHFGYFPPDFYKFANQSLVQHISRDN